MFHLKEWKEKSRRSGPVGIPSIDPGLGTVLVEIVTILGAGQPFDRDHVAQVVSVDWSLPSSSGEEAGPGPRKGAEQVDGGHRVVSFGERWFHQAEEEENTVGRTFYI